MQRSSSERSGPARASALPGWRPAAALLAAGLLLAAAAAHWQAEANTRRIDAALQQASGQLAERIGERLQRYAFGLRGARGAVLVAGSEALRREQFRTYVRSRDLVAEFPGARGFGFVRRVPLARQAAFVAAAQAEGRPGFALRQLAAHEGERYVIQYVEPEAGNEASIGLDIASEGHRREAAERAAHSGQAAITRPITLVQATGQPQQGFLVLLPVYRPGLPLDSAAQRWAACVGWAYAPLVIDEVLQPFGLPEDGLVLQLSDTGEGGTRFYDSGGAAGLADGAPAAGVAQAVFGRQWQLNVRAQPAFVERLELTRPGSVFAGGALLSLLAALLLQAALQGRRSRDEAREQQQRLAALVASSSDAIVAEDLQGRITGWNAAAEALFGHRADEALGRPGPALLLPPEQQPAMAAACERLRRGEAVEPFDAVGLRRDGTPVELAVTLSPIRGRGGRLLGIGQTLRDAGARRAAERARVVLTQMLEAQVAERTAALETARRDLQTVLDALPSVIGCWDLTLHNRFANRAITDWFGVAPPALHGRHLRELLGEELLRQHRPRIEAALRGEPQTYEQALPLPGAAGAAGGVRHALLHLQPDRVDGRVQGFYVLLHDITEITESRRRLADALRANEALLHTLQAHALVTVADAQGRLLEASEGWCRLSGYGRDELLGQDHRIVASGVHGAAFWQAMWATLAAGQPWRGEICNRARDGRLYWLDSVIAPFAGADGRTEKYIAISTDITASKAAAAALQAALQAAEAANRAKSAFLANVSHEVRTPLNAMIGLSYLLAQTGLDAEQRGLLAKVQQASRALLGLIDDVLDLARIEGGQAWLDEADFDLDALLDALAAAHGPAAAAKGLALVVERRPELPRRLHGDAARLAQMLHHLLDNAIKFTPAGSVTLVLQTLPGAGPLHGLLFTVRDTGIGIAPELQPGLFRPFAQADASATRQFGGTGLGLAIVRQLAELMGGEVALQSVPGQGSAFSLRLALRPAQAPAAAAAGGAVDGLPALQRLPLRRRLPRLRVLVVDDSAINREVAARILAREGAVVDEAAGGAEAVAALAQRADADATAPAFDLVLMDVQMPGMDGLEATRRIRALPGGGALPVLALTAGALASERQRALDAGMDDFVTKPVDPERLVQTVRAAVERARGQPLPEEVPPADEAGAAEGSAAADPWPALAELDEDAAHRLGHDAALLRRQLRRLLREFGDLALAPGMPPLPWPAAAELAARAHKLRGVAGLIGARAVQRAALALESAAREATWGPAGPAPAAAPSPALAPLLAELGAALHALRTASAPLLAATGDADGDAATDGAVAAAGGDARGPAGASAGDPAVTPALPLTELALLRERLSHNDLAAQAQFERLAPALRLAWGPERAERFERLREAIDNLQFRQALALLQDTPAPLETE